jgi:hypothetical protein
MEVRSRAWRTDLALLQASGSEVDDRGDHLVVRTPEYVAIRIYRSVGFTGSETQLQAARLPRS